MPETGTIRPVERILYLKKIPMLANLPSPELAALAENARERYFSKGQELLREGEPVSTVYLIVDGSVRVSRGNTILGNLGPGAPLGGVSLLARDERGVRAVAQAETFVLSLDRETLIEVCEDHFLIVHEMMSHLCRWFIEFQRKRWPSLAGVQALRRTEASPPADGEMDFVERIFVLRKIPAFERASINALAELSRGLTEVRFGEGVTLWQEGDAAHYILLTVSGTVVCSAAGHPEKVSIGRGVALGAVEAVAEAPRWYEAVTETPLVALHAPVEGLVDVFEDNFEMAMDYLAVLARLVLAELDREAVEAGADAARPLVEA
jgi:CRP-like cAMP-binding protein